MALKMYVGNLTYDVTDAGLSEMFAAFGQVKSAQIIMDRATGQSKGFGFVEMSNDNEARAAMKRAAAVAVVAADDRAAVVAAVDTNRPPMSPSDFLLMDPTFCTLDSKQPRHRVRYACGVFVPAGTLQNSPFELLVCCLPGRFAVS
jgi:RNA recognition motif-containing protein